jgi:hypothetical protein
VLATSIRPPSVQEVKKLDESDYAIMSALAYSLKERIQNYIDIDPFTAPDPFDEKQDYNYSIFVDRQNPNRLVAMIASKKNNPLPQLPWSKILTPRLARVSVAKQEALGLKSELMPKNTNNFYPYRRSGRIDGYIMFAFQICGQH